MIVVNIYIEYVFLKTSKYRQNVCICNLAWLWFWCISIYLWWNYSWTSSCCQLGRGGGGLLYLIYFKIMSNHSSIFSYFWSYRANLQVVFRIPKSPWVNHSKTVHWLCTKLFGNNSDIIWSSWMPELLLKLCGI